MATFLKIGVIVGLALGIVVLNPELKMPAMTQYMTVLARCGKVLCSDLFITIACGHISRFRALNLFRYNAGDSWLMKPTPRFIGSAQC
ncbi:carbon starvation CstA family protein [Shigella flexneri]